MKKTTLKKTITESQLNNLDSLANKGYITPAEYKSRRKAIIDGS